MTNICKQSFNTVIRVLEDLVTKYRGFVTIDTEAWHTVRTIPVDEHNSDDSMTLCWSVNTDERWIVLRLIADDQSWIKFVCNWTADGQTVDKISSVSAGDEQLVLNKCPDKQLVDIFTELGTELQHIQQTRKAQAV